MSGFAPPPRVNPTNHELSEPVKRYTLAEAERELKRRECATYGHSYDHIEISDTPAKPQKPIGLICETCGASWKVTPNE